MQRSLPATRWRFGPVTAAAAITTLLLGLGVVAATPAHAQSGCQVQYSVANQWPGGFNGSVEITNLGAPIDGWELVWTFPSGQSVEQAWNAEVSQSGSEVTATDAGYNASIGTNGTVSFGFNGSWSGSNDGPTSFALNGVTCDGGVDPTDPPTDPTDPPTDPTDPPDPPDPPSGDLVGWATQNGGTTGGAGGSTVTVNSGSQLISEMQSSGPRVIQVSGTISISGMNDVASDKTIIGLGGSSGITGGGIDVDGVSNVIIRNLNFSNWDDDAINLQESSTNVWIDHNSFTNGNDGAIDIKRESDFVTVSWNHIFNHDKSMLLGHSDDHTEDVGHLRVTYHHNWFDGSEGRHPRVRFGNPVHVFNNYYLDNSGYGVASTMDAGVLVEGNYFEDVDDPTHVGYAASDPGDLVERNNVYDNSGSPESTGGGVNSIPYGYDLDDPNSIPNLVSNNAGPGNI